MLFCHKAICVANLRCFVANQFLSQNYALLSVKFVSLKMCECKKKDKYEVCTRVLELCKLDPHLLALVLQLLVGDRRRLMGHFCQVLALLQQPLHALNLVKGVLYDQLQRVVVTKVFLQVSTLSNTFLHLEI